MTFLGDWQLQISQNGYDFSEESLTFEYRAPVQIHTVLPPKGPTNGGTPVYVTGDGFDSRAAALHYMSCSFSNVIVLAELVDQHTIRCWTRSAPPGLVSVEVTTNNVDYSSDGRLFEFAVMRVYAAAPFSGPTAGGTYVVLQGDGLVPPYGSALYCQWGTHNTMHSQG